MRLEVDVAGHRDGFAYEACFGSDSGITALFGRSGAGKTTLLQVLAGLAAPARGRVVVGDTVFVDTETGTHLPVQARRVGYVFQEGRLLPHLTVAQNLRYGRFFTPSAARYADPAHVVDLLDLGGLLDRRPARLSGGEQQRVAIGRALLASPRLLLMDEPLASLDPHRKREILYYVERLRDEIRVPIVYVSHSLEEVMRLADTLVLVSDGRVIASDTPQALAARLELRAYLGRYEGGAIIDARVAAHDLAMGLTRLEFAGGSLYAPDVDALVGETVRARVRARDVSLALAPPERISILNVLPGTVCNLGGVQGASLDVQVAVGDTMLIARITRKSAETLGIAPGVRVYALVKAVSIDRHSVGFA